MNLLFNIQSTNINAPDADLYVTLDSQGISYIILENGVCRAMLVYHFDEGTSDETAAGYIHQVVADQPVLQQRFNKIHIIYGFVPSVMVPHQFMDGTNNNDMLELVYGDAGENLTRTDFMYRHALHIVYTVPSVVDMVVAHYFVLAEHTHIYSLLPDIIKETGNHLYCIFGTGKLKAMLMKEGKLQVQHDFDYTTKEDVAYYLLNTCKCYDVDPQQVVVHLCGMIDERSALYSELFKYFLQLQFEPLPARYQYPEGISQYPAHYFSHLFALAACV